jgi:Fe-S-cluster-containing dehydrogenase component
MTAPRFVFHAERCTGCEACVLGCWMENRAVQTKPWRQVRTFNPHRHPDLPVFHLSLACHHCVHPACLENCPAGAYTRDAATGAVTVHAEACMGCRYCTWACPHDAPRFSEATGTVEKCTFCRSRLEQGQEPACVARCPVEALEVEPREGPCGGPAPRGFHGWDLEPGIRFTTRETAPRFASPPEPGPVARALASLLTVPEPKITLKGEWTLVVFTTILSLATARMAAGAPFARPWLILAALAGSMALSAAHLGRPARAWRALLNVRRSWLSRELALASAFLGLSVLAFVGLAPAWAAAAAGFAALFAVDRVYQVAVKVPPLNFHSAHALFNGLYLAGILGGWWPLALGAGIVKLFLYAFRKVHFARRGRPLRPAWSLLRVAAGFLCPMALPGTPWAALGAVAGDLVDRCEYYDELEIPGPARDLAL